MIGSPRQGQLALSIALGLMQIAAPSFRGLVELAWTPREDLRQSPL
jgi:hypothetical protein